MHRHHRLVLHTHPLRATWLVYTSNNSSPAPTVIPTDTHPPTAASTQPNTGFTASLQDDKNSDACKPPLAPARWYWAGPHDPTHTHTPGACDQVHSWYAKPALLKAPSVWLLMSSSARAASSAVADAAATAAAAASAADAAAECSLPPAAAAGASACCCCCPTTGSACSGCCAASSSAAACCCQPTTRSVACAVLLLPL
ncbi:hypothetical protein COO60DRAFT_1482702 [Scenedesmus sp. NREL 46B-D3]|nr:hypothetical protein COO60DRAFT_1482702 [Scenedesmus sp. NREL 46B-D3]